MKIKKSLSKALPLFLLLTSTLSADYMWDSEPYCDDEQYYVGEHWAPDYGWNPILPPCFSRYTGDINLSYDYFRSLPEGSFEGNTGAFASINFGLPILRYYCYDFGSIQIGASYGVYDWSGRSSTLEGNPKEVQQQGFVTAGYYRKTCGWSGFNFGVVYDWMINENYGVFAHRTGLAQVRGQIGYLFRRCNEFGIWGTLDVHRSHKHINSLPVIYRALSQANLFWTHYFQNCAETTLWAGVPYKKSLMFNSGRAGQYIVGGSFRVPLTYCLNIEGHGTYMHAKRLPSRYESKNYAANLCFGITYSFGCQPTCCEDCDVRPYQPLANNSNFLADTNLNF